MTTPLNPMNNDETLLLGVSDFYPDVQFALKCGSIVSAIPIVDASMNDAAVDSTVEYSSESGIPLTMRNELTDYLDSYAIAEL